MKPRHQVSRAAIDLIKRFEGYRAQAAQLPDGRWTIGHGHTLTARQGAEVSEQDAEALLLYDLIGIAHVVNELTYTPLTQNQFDALCCFVFNVGPENFKRSSVLRRVNEGNLLQAACAMEMWRKADFEGERIVVDALVRRRSAEKTLFLTPAGGWVPAPSPIVRPKVDYDAVQYVPRQAPVALNAPMTGPKAVVERDGPAPEAVVQPVSASLTAAAAVTARLHEIVPETPAQPAPQPTIVEVVQPAAPVAVEVQPEPEPPPEPTVVTAAEPPAAEPVQVPEPVSSPIAWAPGPAVEGVLQPAEAEVVEVVAEPAPQAFEPEPPLPAPHPVPTYQPTGTDGGAEAAFTLTPAPEVEPEPAQTLPHDLPQAANESEPGLFDIAGGRAAEQATPVRSSALLSEDHIRRLVEEDERVAEFGDVDNLPAASEPVRIQGLPWIVGGLAGAGVGAGGVAWALTAATGDPLTNWLGWGAALGGASVAFVSVWRWLELLGVPRLEADNENDETPPAAE